MSFQEKIEPTLIFLKLDRLGEFIIEAKETKQ